MERALTLVTEVGKRVRVRENGSGQTAVATRQAPTGATAVFLDLDTVLLDKHPGKYGPELSVQADISAALMRLSEVVDKVVVVVNPKPADGGHVMDTDH